MLIKARFMQGIMLQAFQNIVLFYFFSHCSDIPDYVLTKNNASNTILVFCIKYFLMFNFNLYFTILSKSIAKYSLHLFSEIFTWTWGLCIFHIIGDHYLRGFTKLFYSDRLNLLAFMNFNRNITLPNRKISRFHVYNLKIDSHFFKKRH